MNYRPIWTISEIEVGRNAQVFATVGEAEESAEARFYVWTVPTDFGTEPTEDEVTYERIEGVDHRLCTT
tara:strand:- start:2312 stop:2518 length:207 start_codon:yes stop_codon:yes gene_type:complete